MALQGVGPLIIVPKMIPPGQRVEVGQKTAMPNCDRCRRTSTERNPVMLSDRKAWTSGEAYGRKDAICHECRLALKGRY
jgi:hypothetical protein